MQVQHNYKVAICVPFVSFIAVRKNIVLVYNPSAVEQVLRNDGQYPLRSLLLSDNMQYLFKDAGLEIPFLCT